MAIKRINQHLRAIFNPRDGSEAETIISSTSQAAWRTRDVEDGGARTAGSIPATGANAERERRRDQRRVQEPFRGKDRRTGLYTYPPPDFLYRRFATEAAVEAKVYSDRGLMEAIYILLRRNDLAQQNATNTPHTGSAT